MQIKELEARRRPAAVRPDRPHGLADHGRRVPARLRPAGARRRCGMPTTRSRGCAGSRAARSTIGMVSTAKYFVPRLLARFRDEHPGVELRLQVGNREELVGACCRATRSTSRSWAGRRASSTRAPSRSPRTRTCRRRGRPSARAAAEPIPPSALAGEGFIVREQGSGTRAAMEKFFTRARACSRAVDRWRCRATRRSSRR